MKVLNEVCLVLQYVISNTILTETRSNISNTRNNVSLGYLNIERRVENMACSGVFLTKYEVFG